MQRSKFQILFSISVLIVQLMLLGTLIYNILAPFEPNTIFRVILAFIMALSVVYTLRRLLKQVILAQN
jgi:hypothetical protein